MGASIASGEFAEEKAEIDLWPSIRTGSCFLGWRDEALFFLPFGLGLFPVLFHIWDYCSRGYRTEDIEPELLLYVLLGAPIFETLFIFIPILGLMKLGRMNFWVATIPFALFFASLHVTWWLLPVSIAFSVTFWVFWEKRGFLLATLYVILQHVMYNLYVTILDPSFWKS